MEKIVWTDDMAVGIEIIDEQHQELVNHLNNLSAAIDAHDGPGKIGTMLEYLIEYTHFHFSEEEKLMKEKNYSQLEEHIAKHDEFKKELADLEEDYREDGPTHRLAEFIDNLMVNWLLKHICKVDKEFAASLNG